jgi:mannose-6-phosphate isomerase-like protein (cupin superfamily)
MTSNVNPLDESAEYFFEEGCFILELSNSADDPSVSIARARVEAGGKTRWHRLSGVIERYVILSGSGSVEVGEEEPTRVSVGDVVTIPAMIPQRITNLGKADLVFLAICTPRFQRVCYQPLE